MTISSLRVLTGGGLLACFMVRALIVETKVLTISAPRGHLLWVWVLLLVAQPISAQNCKSAWCRLSANTVAAHSADSGSQQIALIAVLPPTLTLSVSDVSLDVTVTDPSRGTGVATIPVSSTWNLNSSMSNVQLIAYFDSPLRALSDNANHSIPSGKVIAGLNDQQLLPFTETSREGTAGASRTLYRQEIGAQNVRASRVDSLRIELKSIADLGAPQGEYYGTLHLRLVAY